MLKELDKWRKTKLGLLVFGLAELAIAYGFLCLSIDRGSLIWYLLTLIFLVGGIQNIFKFIGKLTNAQRKTSKA